MARRRKSETRDAFNARMAEYQRARRAERLWEGRVFLGEHCVRCRVHMDDTVLEFDHIDPSTKKFNLARQASHVSEDRWWDEVLKCQLLCFDCHMEKCYEDGTRGTEGRYPNDMRT